MAGIKDYSTTNLSNTSLNGISVAEGMLPSNLNNAIRALMVNTREWFNDSQWVEYGDGDGAYTAAYASATSFTIAGVDVTPIYHAGRRIKLIATTPGTIYGTISSSSFSTDTTINVTWDSGSLSNETIDNVYIGALSKTNSSIPEGVIATVTLADGSVTTVKIADSAVTTAKINDSAVTTAKINADAVTGAKIADDSIDSEHYVDASIDTQHIANSQITTAKIADSNVTTAKIADSNVTTAKLATNAVTTAKITDANVTTAKIAADAIDGTKIADDSINSEHYADGSIDTQHIADSQITTAKIADSNITTAKIADSNVTTAKIADSNVTTAKIANDAVTADKIADAVIVTNAEASGHTPDDVTFFTTSASDNRYFREDSSETISSGDTWSGSDSYIATTAAIDARIIDLVDDVGGFYPIANETSFPNTNPDVNDGAGTIISIKEIATTRTPTAGTVTISGGTLGGSTVTITGCGSTVLTAGFGVLVETTSTLNTYTFHRLVPKATEVTTVAAISSDITTVAGISANVTSVAGISADVSSVAAIDTDISAVAAIDTNVTTVANNITDINTFAVRYRIGATNPTTSLDEGDLFFNSTDNELKFYNGSAWSTIQGGISNVVDDITPQLGGNLDLNSKTINGTGTINFTGDVTATNIAGAGASITALNASNLASGTVPDARFPATLPAISGSNLTNLNASNLASGTVPTARLSGAYTGITQTGTLTSFSSTGIDDNATSTAITIDSSENVGIGTSTPSSTQRLTLKGDFSTIESGILFDQAGNQTVISHADATSPSFIISNKTSNGVLRFDTNNNERMRINSSGNIGIGTSSPSQLLHVNGHIVGNSLNIPSNTTSPPSGVTIHKPANDIMAFRTASTERMRIDSSGNVGIGTSSPSSPLDVVSSGTNNQNLLELSSASGIRTYIATDAQDDALMYLYDSTSSIKVAFRTDGNASYINGGGNLGIGTSSPAEKLDVNGTIKTSSGYIPLQTLTDGATISWNMDTQQVARVTLGGNRTISAPTNANSGQIALLEVKQDATGGRTLTWNAIYEFKDDTAPTLTTTASKADLFVFYYNGSKWQEVGRNQNLTIS